MTSRLLAESARYALGSLTGVRDEDLGRATPCAGWDLEQLLHHLADSLAALTELRDLGITPLESVDEVPRDPISAIRRQIATLVAAWNGQTWPATCAIGDRPLASTTVAAVGAIELTAHGWDIYTARHIDRAIPARLAMPLLTLGHMVIPDRTRYPEFAAALPVEASATPSARLLGFLGRSTSRSGHVDRAAVLEQFIARVPYTFELRNCAQWQNRPLDPA
jgi:uncharacterized protein (TIGR03086 family)